jgi:uncharacterized protein (DUF58 family)
MLGPQPPPTESPPLFSETFLRRLERVSLIARHIRSGHNKGERRSHKRGSSVEFADYRNYSPGDDLRRLDWRVYARLERPFIKLFEEEEDQTVHLVIDASGSMNWPEGEAELNKWNFSRKLVAALGYIALASGDRLTVSQLNQGRHSHWGPHRGRGQVHSMLQYLLSLGANGPTDLNAALRHLALAKHRPGLLFLVTDFFSPGGYEQGLAALGNAGHELNILHLLSPDEMEPALLGDLRLYDVETGEAQEVTIDPGLHRLYRQRFEAWRNGIESYCFSRNINYLTLSSALVFENVMLGYLRQRGFVR